MDTRIDLNATTRAPQPPRRFRHRRQPLPHAWGDGVPTLASLAAPLGLRVYQDACGDENLPGRFGEIFRHGPGCLAVQFGGVRANGTPVPSRRKMRWRLRQTKRLGGLRRIVLGDDEALFHFPEALLPQVAQLMGAYRAYARTGPSETCAAAA